MDYEQALKKVLSAKKAVENYLVITLNYDHKLILPYKDGLTFLSSLNQAEQLNEPYNKPHRITDLDRSKISVAPMSHEDYQRFKISALLNLTMDEVRALQESHA